MTGTLPMLLRLLMVTCWARCCLMDPTAPTGAMQGRCSAGWLNRPDSSWCYLMSDAPANYKSWQGARQACAMQHAHLLTVTDAGERDWLAHKINSYTAGDRYWWLGLNRLEGTWSWEDGSVTTGNRRPGSKVETGSLLSWWPSITDLTQGRCLAIYRDPGNRGLLRVWPRDCETKYKYICKKMKRETTACDKDNGWELHNTKCYKVQSYEANEGIDWDEASSKCNADEADLASVPDRVTGAFIGNLIASVPSSRGRNFWLGLRTRAEPGDPSGYSWRWPDGSRLTYEAWSTGSRPKVSPDRISDTCALAISRNRRMLWRDFACNGVRLGFVCARAAGICASGWYQHRDACYSMHHRELSWDEADAYCWSQGASLVQIRQKHVQDFVNAYKDDFMKQGVGFVWIGLRKDTGAHSLTWTASGEAATAGFTNWAQGEPMLDSSRPNAARMLATSEQGVWEAASPVDKGGFVCEIPLGRLPQVPTTETPRFHCKLGWHLYGRSCYKFYELSTVWPDAKLVCRAQPGGDLVDIRDAAEQEFVQGQLNVKRNFWIGLRARGSPEDQRWIWSLDGTAASFFNWRRDSPRDHGDTDCVEADPSGRWNNVGCENRNAFVCKLSANLGGAQPTAVPATTAPAWDPFCGPLWSRDSSTNYCYMFNTDPLAWLDAKHLCEHQGGKLMSIASESEKAFIVNRMQEVVSTNPGIVNFWIGFNDRAVEGFWVWDDNQPVAYLNWAPGEPDNSGDVEDCAVVHPSNAQWFDNSCGKRYASICKKLGNIIQTTKSAAVAAVLVPDGYLSSCRDGYTRFEGMCYRVHGSTDDVFTWDEALKRCRVEGGSLVSVTSLAEHQFLLELAREQGNNFSFWIGLYDRISLQRTMQFQWADRYPVTYTSWHRGRPSNSGVKEDCAEIVNSNGWNGNWNDLSCSEARRYACKQRQILVNVSKTTVTKVRGCSADYTDAYGGYCFKFVTGTAPITAAAAQKMCQYSGGILATIPNKDVQNHFILKLTSLKVNSDFWIGLTRTGLAYQWDDRRPVTYTNWKRGALLLGNRASMSAQTGQWEMSANLSVVHFNYICQTGQLNGSPTPASMHAPVYSACPQGWFETDNSCYKSFNAANASGRLGWSEARSQCRKLHGDLATISSEEALKTLSQTVRGTIPYWIGLNARDSNKGFAWANGKPAGLFNWRGGKEPVDVYGNKNCVQLHPSDMSWTIENCSATQNWLCEVQKGANNFS